MVNRLIDKLPRRERARVYPATSRNFKHYLYLTTLQPTQSATCFRFHEVAVRLARVLLVVHGRAHSDHFRPIHQFLANIPDVLRGGVTSTTGRLQKEKIIRYARRITILNRKSLEVVSRDCYSMVIDGYIRLLP